MTEVRTFSDIKPDDAESVGGKGLSLGLLAGAGLPVPPGFCVTSAAHRRIRPQTPAADPGPARRHRRRLSKASAAAPSPSARRPPPRTAPPPASPGSRKPSSASADPTPSATPSAAAGRRSTPNAPSPTAGIRASPTTDWRWPSSSSAWCRPKYPACCSPAIRSTPTASACSSRRRGVSAKASFPAASRPTSFTSTATPAPSSNGTSTPRPPWAPRPAMRRCRPRSRRPPVSSDAATRRVGGTGP